MIGALSTQQVEAILHSEFIGRIGCHADGKTYVVPVTYAYDGERILAHSAEGEKLRLMRANPEVCFEVDHVDDLANWRSVIAWGRFEELRDAEAMAALNLLVEKTRPIPTSETTMLRKMTSSKGPTRAVVYGIRLREKTGRYEKR